MVVTQNSMHEHLGESILLVSRNKWFIMSCGQLTNLLNSKKLFVKLIINKKIKGINDEIMARLAKKLNSSLSFGQAALTFFFL